MKRLAVFFAVLAIALPSFGQQHPNRAKGFNANSVHQVNDYDSINAFNGNLTVSIPLGSPYPLNSDVGVQFTLYSNANVWDGERYDYTCDPDGAVIRTYGYPHRRANAGLGWTLTLGRLYAPLHPTAKGWTFESPDGADHELKPSDTANVLKTTDGSFLRMRTDTTDRLVEFPDGRVYTFSLHPHRNAPEPDAHEDEEWMLTKISNQFGELAYVQYDYDASHRISQWRVHAAGSADPFAIVELGDHEYEVQLQEYPYASTRPVQYARFVDRLKLRLAPSPAPMAEYSFAYHAAWSGRSAEVHNVKPACMPQQNSQARVSYLDTVTLPDGTHFDFSYEESTDGLGPVGLPVKMTLPTGGIIGWDYLQWWKPDWSDPEKEEGDRYTWGVATRNVFNRGATSTSQPVRTTTYTPRFDDNADPTDDPIPDLWTRYQKTTVSESGTNKKTVLYFDVERHYDHLDRVGHNYGRPFTTLLPLDGNTDTAYRSKELMVGNTVVETTYVRYEDDESPDMYGPIEGARLVRTYVERNDDPIGPGNPRWIDTRLSNYAGHGHYRIQTVTGTGLGTRTTTTNYLGLPSTGKWLTGLFDSVTVTDGTQTAKSLYTFDPHNGFLKEKRTLRGDTEQAHDLLAKFTANASGNVATEEYYGGDKIAVNHPCAIGGSTPCYKIAHTYSSGVRNTSQYAGADFKSLELVIDAASRLPIASTDPAGIVTTFQYDKQGRIEAMKPAGTARSQYVYTPAGGTSGGSVAMARYASGDTTGTNPLTQARYHYDDFGRLVQESNLLPGGWSTTWTEFDVLGRKSRVSVPERTSSGDQEKFPVTARYTKWTYDDLGRVREIRQPDLKLVRFDYTGNRLTTRRVNVATSTTAETEVATREEHDMRGRLASVTEGFGNSPLTTLYRYDLGDRLIEVKADVTGGQTRELAYDDAGLLQYEDHPESAKTTYLYDAKGNVLEKKTGTAVTLHYDYDPAERLEQVFDVGGGNWVKQLQYDPGKGRIATQKRRNAFNGAAYVVTDTFLYDTVGRVRSKETTVDDGTPPADHFVHNFDYNDLGGPDHLKFPTCTTCGGVGTSERALKLTYDQGLLTGIENVTAGSGITYTAAGAVNKVQHAKRGGGAGVLETYIPDSSGMSRPSAIRFESAVDCGLIVAEPGDQTVLMNQSATLTVNVLAGATVEWFRGTVGDDSELAGTGTSLVIPAVTQTSTYWCRVRMTSGGCEELSREARVSVCAIPEIVPNPDPQYTVSSGATVHASVIVASQESDLAYEWTIGAAGPVIGRERTVLYTAPILAAGAPSTVHELYVKVTGACGSTVPARIATITVIAPPVDEPPCVATFGVTPDPKFTVSVPNAGLRLDASLALSSGNSPEYHFRWWENDKLVSSVDQNDPATHHNVYIRSVDKIVVLEAWATCTSGPSQKLRTESYGTVHGRCTPPTVEVTPESYLIETGTEALTFTAKPSRPDVTYQWYRGMSGNTSAKLAGATSATLQAEALVGSYWVRVTADCGSYADSPTVTVSTPACSPVTFNSQPQDAHIDAGTAVKLTADASGNPAPNDFQWYMSPSAQIIGATSPSYTVRPYRTTDYWALAANGCHSAVTRKARIHVVSCAAMTIHAQPQDRFAGQTDEIVQIGATPTSASETLRYQWYKGETGDTREAIAGATLSTLTVPQPAAGAYWARLSFSDPSQCAVDSRTVRVCAPPVQVGTTNHRNSSVPGLTQVLVVNVEGDNLEYAWYVGSVSETTKLSSISDVAQVAPHTTTTYVCRITSRCGTETRTLDIPVTVSVCPQDVAEPVAQRTMVMPGTTTVLSINAPDATQIDWYGRPSNLGTAGTHIGSGASVTTPAITQQMDFWAVVRNGTCPRESAPVTVELCSGVSVQWSTGNPSRVALNQSVTLNVSGYGTDLMYTFYEGAESGNVSASTVVRTSNAGSYTYSAAATRKFWVRVTGGNGCWAQTTVHTVEVCVPTITTQPQSAILDKTSNATASVTLSVAATPSTGLTYQWYTGSSGNVTAPIAGATGATYNASPSADTSYWVRVTGACTEGAVSRDSNAALVTVCKPPAITEQTSGTNIIANQSVILSVKATGTELTYRWYRGAAGGTSTPLTSTATTLEISPSETTDYWARVTGRCGTADSQTMRVSVKPVITTQPVGGVIMPGGSRTLSVAATGNLLTYQWYSVVNTTTTAITGATATSYVAGPLTVDTTYFVRVRSGNATVDSEHALVDVCTPPVLQWATGIDTKVRPYQYQVLSFTGASDPHTTQWYYGNTGDVTSPFSSAETVGVQPAATTKYWVRVTVTATGCTADSPTLTLQVCDPTITTQPAPSTTIDKISNPSASATLSVVANAGPHTYQWYVGAPGVTTSPITGATAASFNASPTVDTTYWVRVTSACGISVNSNAATVVLCKAPAITQQPASQRSLAGHGRTLSVTATGTDLTYQWYVGTSGTTTAPVTNGTSSSIVVSPNVTTDYWVKVTGRCGSANSSTAKISIPPVITTQPQSASVTSGSTRTLTVAASGTQLTYQWYSVTGTTASLITGATSASYLTPPITSTIAYYCRVRSGTEGVDSAQATMTVCQPRAISVSAPSSVSGSAVTLSVVGAEAGESFEWYAGASGNVSAPLGTGTTKTVYPTVTTYYWARTKRATCDADSAAVKVSVCIPKITTQPVSSTIVSNGSVTLSAAATGTPTLTYQWYLGATGDTSQPISGATGASYATGPLTATRSYWVRVSSPLAAGCSISYANSSTATVTVCNPPVITAHPSPRLITSTEAIIIQVSATGDGLGYQWYEGLSGDTSKPVGTNSHVLNLVPGTTKYYWVRVSGTCGAVNSNAALMSVYPKITTQPVSDSVCTLPDTGSFSVVATGTSLTYQWQRQAGTAAWEVLTGETSPTLNTTITQVPTYFRVGVTSGNATTWSEQASFTVNPRPTITNLTRTFLYSSTYRLTVWVPYEEQELGVTYQWFRGALGDTSQPVGGDSSSVQVVVTPPQTYWVRVSYYATGCSSTRSTSF